MKDNINILIFGPSIENGMAGSKRLLHFVTGFIGFNYKVSIISNRNQQHTKTSILNTEISQFSLGSQRNIFVYIYRFLYIINSIYNRNHKNVFYIYGYPNITNIVPIIFARKKGFLILFDIVEDNFTIKKYKTIFSYIKVVSSKLLYKLMGSFSEGAIGISSHLVNLLEQSGVNKVKHIPISVDFTNPIFIKKIEKFKSSEKQIGLFYGGSFAEKDGLMFLLKAFNNLVILGNDLILNLTGKGRKSDIDIIEEYIIKNDLISRVKFHGYISDDKYYELLHNSDILCMTRTSSAFANAGFPFKLGEMLSTKKPVIATNVGDVSLYLNNKSNAIVIEPESSVCIEEAITFIMQNTEEARKIGLSGYQTALKFFNAEIISRDLCEFIDRL